MFNVVPFWMTFLPYLELKFHLKQHFSSYSYYLWWTTVYDFSPIVKSTKLFCRTFLIFFCSLPSNYSKECCCYQLTPKISPVSPFRACLEAGALHKHAYWSIKLRYLLGIQSFSVVSKGALWPYPSSLVELFSVFPLFYPFFRYFYQ